MNSQIIVNPPNWYDEQFKV